MQAVAGACRQLGLGQLGGVATLTQEQEQQAGPVHCVSNLHSKRSAGPTASNHCLEGSLVVGSLTSLVWTSLLMAGRLPQVCESRTRLQCLFMLARVVGGGWFH